MEKIMEIKKDMVFEYVDGVYKKYFIPKKNLGNAWYGLELDEEFNIIDYNNWLEDTLNHFNDFKLAEKTLETVYIGDIICDRSNENYRKVLDRNHNMLFLTNCSSNPEGCVKDTTAWQHFIGELIDNGWSIYKEPVKIKLTKKQIAKKFKIDINLLEIK